MDCLPFFRFSINITERPGCSESAGVGLHVNPRFHENPDKVPEETIVVRNSYLEKDKGWGKEERKVKDEKVCPLQPGQKFQCVILTAMEEFKVCILKYNFVFIRKFTILQRERQNLNDTQGY